MENSSKSQSKFHKKINHLHDVISKFQGALERRKKYTQNSDRFVRMLLETGRTSKEELSEYYKRVK